MAAASGAAAREEDEDDDEDHGDGAAASASLRAARSRGSFVSSLAKTSELSVSTQVDPATGRRVVAFGVPPRYMDLQEYDEKTSGRLPLETVRRLKQWVVDNWSHPYPQEVEKAVIAQACDMSHQQVSNWFRNERKRVWLPLKRRAEKHAHQMGIA